MFPAETTREPAPPGLPRSRETGERRFAERLEMRCNASSIISFESP